MPLPERPLLREALGELLGSSVLLAVVFASGAVRVELGAGTMGAALLGSIALGLGYGVVLWSFGRMSGAQTNPLVSAAASLIGHRPWGRTLVRVIAQVMGAGTTGLAVSYFARSTFVHAAPYLTANPVAELIGALGFMLVALGVAHRRDAKVPAALGAFATASFWMTGRGSVGNPLLSLTVLVVAMGGRTSWSDLFQIGGANVVGSAIGVLVGLYLFPRAREAASSLVFVPGSGAP